MRNFREEKKEVLKSKEISQVREFCQKRVEEDSKSEEIAQAKRLKIRKLQDSENIIQTRKNEKYIYKDGERVKNFQFNPAYCFLRLIQKGKLEKQSSEEIVLRNDGVREEIVLENSAKKYSEFCRLG